MGATSSKMADGLTNALDKVWNEIKSVIEKAGDFIKGLIEGIKRFLGSIFSLISSLLGKIFSKVARVFEKFLTGIIGKDQAIQEVTEKTHKGFDNLDKKVDNHIENLTKKIAEADKNGSGTVSQEDKKAVLHAFQAEILKFKEKMNNKIGKFNTDMANAMCIDDEGEAIEMAKKIGTAAEAEGGADYSILSNDTAASLFHDDDGPGVEA